MNEVTTQTFERRQQTISEKIVQLNEEVIKDQIRELVRGKRGGGADLLRSPRRAPDAHPHKQRDRAAEPGDPSTHPRGGDIPRWQLRPDAGLRPASPCGGDAMGLQKIHEHEALGGGAGRRLYCRLTSFSRSLQTILRMDLDSTSFLRAVERSEGTVPGGIRRVR